MGHAPYLLKHFIDVATQILTFNRSLPSAIVLSSDLI